MRANSYVARLADRFYELERRRGGRQGRTRSPQPGSPSWLAGGPAHQLPEQLVGGVTAALEFPRGQILEVAKSPGLRSRDDDRRLLGREGFSSSLAGGDGFGFFLSPRVRLTVVIAGPASGTACFFRGGRL